MQKQFLSPFIKIITTAIFLAFIGLTGLLVIVFFTEPTLGPRWLAYFFLTLLACGLILPFVYIFQRRIAKQPLADGVLIREALLFAIYVDLIVWLQLGRVLNGLIAIFLAGGFIILEILLRMSETALFKADANSDD
jgi:hypothetical protein